MRNPPPKRQCLAFALLVCAGAAGVHAAETRYGIDAEWLRDSNLNRAAYSKEERSDDLFSAEAYAARSRRISDRSGLVLRGGVRLRAHREFNDLNQLAALGRVVWRMQPSPGFTRPWFELAGGAEFLRHSDSALRDGYVFSGSVSAGKYFTDRIRLDAGAGLDQRFGRDGSLYDLSTRHFRLGAEYLATRRVTVYGNVKWLTGDHVFTANDPGTQSYLIPVSDVIVSDPAFSSAFGGAANVAYRIQADTRLTEIGVNIPIRGNQALDFGITTIDSTADGGGGSYDGTLWRASYLYRFE